MQVLETDLQYFTVFNTLTWSLIIASMIVIHIVDSLRHLVARKFDSARILSLEYTSRGFILMGFFLLNNWYNVRND